MTKNNETIQLERELEAAKKWMGMSQEELAEKMFTSKQMTLSYKNNKTKVKVCVLREMSQVLGTTITYLTEGVTETIYYDVDTMELIGLFIEIRDEVVHKVAIEQLRALKALQE